MKNKIHGTRDLIKRYNELHPGKYWFDEDTMDFFNTVIEHVYSNNGYFITSERMELDDPKRYSIRQLTDKPEQVITHGEFCMYPSLAAAMAAYSFAYEKLYTAKEVR